MPGQYPCHTSAAEGNIVPLTPAFRFESPPTTSLMAHLFLALFLLVFGLNLLFGLSIPLWVTGLLAVVAGTLLVMEYFRIRVDRK